MMNSHYWNVNTLSKARTKVCKSSLSFFINFSLSSKSVTFYSSSKPLFLHFIDLSTYITCHSHQHFTDSKVSVHCRTCDNCNNGMSIVFYRSHSLYTWHMKHIQNLNGLSIVVYHSRNPYTQQTKRIQTTAQCGACSGSPQLWYPFSWL